MHNLCLYPISTGPAFRCYPSSRFRVARTILELIILYYPSSATMSCIFLTLMSTVSGIDVNKLDLPLENFE